MKKALTALILLVLVVSVVFEVQPALVNANFLYTLPEITIKSDGTIEPETQYITRTGNVYTLTKNLTRVYAVVIKCSNIVFDGAGFSIDGSQEYLNGPSYMNTGLILQNVTNVTVKDLSVLGFAGGGSGQMKVVDCFNCSFFRVDTLGVVSEGGFNSFFECSIGLIVHGSDGTVICNGNVSLGIEGSSVLVFGNNLKNVFCDGVSSVWDNGFVGNYWSDYCDRYPNASEIGNTGIGDTPYVIDTNNVDHYPLIHPYVVPEIKVDCAENDTYTDSFALNFTVNKSVSWVGYSLDGAGNVTVSGNTTITGISSGPHTITVYFRDVYGFEGASNTVTFTTTAQTASPELFPTVPVAVVVGILAVIAVYFLFFGKKP